MFIKITSALEASWRGIKILLYSFYNPKNLTAVALATLASFVLGWLWHGPLFGNAWAREMKMDRSVKPDPKVMIKGLILTIIGNFFMAYVLAHDVYAWSLVPGIGNMKEGFSIPFQTAFFLWLGYYVPTHIGATIWENKSWKLTTINLGYHFTSLLIAAIIITKM